MDRDSILVANTLNGDIHAFEELMDLYKKRLFGFLFKLTLSREDSEEILQEVFIKAYNYLYRYNGKYSFCSWIFKIALNIYKTESKKKKRVRNAELYEMIPEEMCSNEGYPEEVFERKEAIAEVVKSLNALKEEQRIAIILKYMKNYTFKEVGNIMGISPEAAKMKVQRAKEILEKRYKGKEGWYLL